MRLRRAAKGIVRKGKKSSVSGCKRAEKIIG